MANVAAFLIPGMYRINDVSVERLSVVIIAMCAAGPPNELHLARVSTGEEILGPLLDPAHRSLELLREVAGEGFLREGRQLQAEGPPHARLDHLDLVLAH